MAVVDRFVGAIEDGDYEAEQTDASVAMMPWGGAKGTARAAFEELKDAGVDVGWYYTMYLNPLPPALLDELRSKERVIVPEPISVIVTPPMSVPGVNCSRWIKRKISSSEPV